MVGNSILDVQNDEDLIGLLSCISHKDAMVMKCIEEELSSYYDEEFGLYSALESDYKEPRGYRTMLKRPYEEKMEWLKGCQKELIDFARRGVWKIIKMHEVPKGRKLIGNKWVFKRKRDGRFRSRLVALGYSQIPGVDYTDNFSPVAGEVTMRICLMIWMIHNLDIDQVDVETAFLEGRLEPHEYQYMQCPEGMDLAEDECMMVTGGMYGLVQVSRVYWKKMTFVLLSIGFLKFEGDQCLFYMKGCRNIIIILAYVDDSLMIGETSDLKHVIKSIE